MLSHGSFVDWHLCGRCLALLVLGLGARTEQSVDPHTDLRALGLRPRSVRDAIERGLQLVAHHGRPPASSRIDLLDRQEQLLDELEALMHEVAQSTRETQSPQLWARYRRDIGRLRERGRQMRTDYLRLLRAPAE